MFVFLSSFKTLLEKRVVKMRRKRESELVLEAGGGGERFAKTLIYRNPSVT